MDKISSLYIHIPYCLSKCKYCDFFRIPCKKENGVPQSYVKALCNEISYRLKKYEWNEGTLYIGGGTPSLLSDEQLSEILNTVKKFIQFDKITEITIELNPDDITEKLLKNLEKNGITRISLGLQSMNEEVLAFAGRRANREVNLRALDCIKKFWKGDFSVDVISALPKESEKTFMKGLEEICSFNPDHISMYSLTIEDETPFGKMYNSNQFDYDWDAADELWLKGREKLFEKGYEQYEISNFSKKNKECNHNLTYWMHKNYIGCGSAACGTVYPVRWTNDSDLKKYISYWNGEDKTDEKNAPEFIEMISKNTEKFEFFMMGLRKLTGITDKEYELYFNEKIPENVIKLFEEWKMKNLAEIQKNNGEARYSFNSQGILFLNRFLEQLDFTD